jgi:hypothetical protein
MKLLSPVLLSPRPVSGKHLFYTLWIFEVLELDE